MTTLKTGSVITTGVGVGDTQPGLLVTFNLTPPAGQAGIQFTDFLNAPIFTVPDPTNGQAACYGDFLGARHSLFDAGNVRIDGRRGPPCALFPDGTASAGLRLWSGTGVPTTTTIGGAATVGDLYIRRDTPTTSNQRVYRCTVAGTPGTWTAVL